MVKCTASFRAHGEGFSPKSAERLTGLFFSKRNERGDLGTSGRASGQPLAYGSGELAVAMDLTAPDPLFFAAVENLVPACLSSGATDMLLHIDVEYTDQCNMEMSPAFVVALSRLGIPVTMTCFQHE
jgi:hypothetical protein